MCIRDSYYGFLKILNMLIGYMLFVVQCCEPYWFYVVFWKGYKTFLPCLVKEEESRYDELALVSDDKVTKEDYITSMQYRNTEYR